MTGSAAARPHVVLAEPDDVGARLVADRLAVRAGEDGVRLLTGAQLAFGSRLVLRAGAGGVTSELSPAGGPAIAPRSVLCRVGAAPPPWAHRASAADVAFAAAEAHALLLAWLASLPCPVVNRPSPRGLAAPVLTDVQWLARAGAAGLPCVAVRSTTNGRDLGVRGYEPVAASAHPPGRRPATLREAPAGPLATAVIVDRRVLGELPAALHPAFGRLAEAAGCRVLGLVVERGPRPRVVAVDPVPPLSGPGEAEAVAALMAAA